MCQCVSLIGTKHIFCQARDFAPGSRETGKGVPSKEWDPDYLRFVDCRIKQFYEILRSPTWIDLDWNDAIGGSEFPPGAWNSKHVMMWVLSSTERYPNAGQALVWSSERTLPLLGGSDARNFRKSLFWMWSAKRGECSPIPTLTTEPSCIFAGSFITLSTSRGYTKPLKIGLIVVRMIRPLLKTKRVSTFSMRCTNCNFAQSSIISVTIIKSSR